MSELDNYIDLYKRVQVQLLAKRISQAFSPCIWLISLKYPFKFFTQVLLVQGSSCNINRQSAFLPILEGLLSPFTFIAKVIPVLDIQAPLLSQNFNSSRRQAFTISITPFKRGKCRHQLVRFTGRLHRACKDQAELLGQSTCLQDLGVSIPALQIVI